MSSVIDSVSWVVVRARRMLVVRTEGKNRFYLPGGKREADESDATCLSREIAEELGVRIETGSMRPFAVLDELADGYSDGRRVHMTAYTADYEGELRPSTEIAELAWFASADAERCPAAGRRVLRMLTERGEID